MFLYFALVPKLVPRTVDFHWYWYRILKFWYRDNTNPNNTRATVTMLSLAKYMVCTNLRIPLSPLWCHYLVNGAEGPGSQDLHPFQLGLFQNAQLGLVRGRTTGRQRLHQLRHTKQRKGDTVRDATINLGNQWTFGPNSNKLKSTDHSVWIPCNLFSLSVPLCSAYQSLGVQSMHKNPWR